MPTNEKYPRVLILMVTKIKADDPTNLLIRAEFGDWPRDCLAQIHGAADPSGWGEFCGHYYALDAPDRSFGRLFQRLRRNVFDMTAMADVNASIENRGGIGVRALWTRLKKRFGDWLIGAGLWEVIFRVRMSKQMEAFIKDFSPDVLYCQGYSLGFAELPQIIYGKFKVPICYQTTDDWPSYTYPGCMMRWLLRHRARRLVMLAQTRMAFGQKMREQYEKVYGVPFLSTFHLDDPRRFRKEPAGVNEQDTIVYMGSLALRRYEALEDTVHALREAKEGSKFRQIVVYCSGIPKDMPRWMLTAPEIVFLPLPSHDEVPGVLAGATALLLPESFTVPRETIEYAISSKAHIYMMSGRPILVYGPRYSGTVDYAVREKWAVVCSERQLSSLGAAMSLVWQRGVEVVQASQCAQNCIRSHHDIHDGRERFRKVLCETAYGT